MVIVNMAGSGGAGSVVELTTDVNASIEILEELGVFMIK